MCRGRMDFNTNFKVNTLKQGRSYSRLFAILLIHVFFFSCLLVNGPAYGQSRFYSICFGSYKNKEYASEAVSRLKNRNYNAFSRYEEVQGKGKYYRVYVGEFNSKIEAEQKADELVTLEIISDYFINTLPDTELTALPAVEQDKEEYYLHVSSFKKRVSAEKEVQRLSKHGHAGTISEEKIDGETWFRVYLGPFKDEKDAQSAGSELKSDGIISFFKLQDPNQVLYDTEQAVSPSSFIPIEQIVGTIEEYNETETRVKTDDVSKDSSIEEYFEREIKAQEIAQADTLDTGDALQINDILFLRNQMGVEILHVYVNRFFDPDVLYIESENPRVFIDIEDARYNMEKLSEIEANGETIRRIRFQAFDDSNKFRIILYLVSGNDYSTDQFFYKEENIFSLFVRKRDIE